MECNKEEAIRAKEIAEKNLEARDFSGARKMALKAQKLYPGLENISKMVMVCEVHCSAEKKIYGNENNWYSILQLQPTADAASIKTQYRKFALLLHPDKNKFAGAADAFRLIGEAQKVLLDRDKRMAFDTKLKAGVLHKPAMRQTSQSNVGKQSWAQNNFTSNASSQFMNQQSNQPKQQSRPEVPENNQTFWTSCPYCYTRYQYYRSVINRSLKCQSCQMQFSGYEINAPKTNQGPSRQQKEATTQGAAQRKTSTTGSASQRADAGEGSEHNAKRPYQENNTSKPGPSKESKRASSKKQKTVSESSESFDSKSSADIEEITPQDDSVAHQGFQRYPRRSSRSKQKVSYGDNLTDDDDGANLFKNSEHKDSSCGAEKEQEAYGTQKAANLSADMQEDEEEVKEKGSFSNDNIQKDAEKATVETAVPPSDTCLGTASEPEVYECPDPDFSDFDKDRKEECFQEGQIWAVYDSLSVMPRFYARIKKILSPGFKLRITWLEPDPDEETTYKWVEEGLPMSCGKFKHGSTEETKAHPMFSHVICWEKGKKRDTYKIYPRKGETWALFKNWDIKWYSDAKSHREYEYDFVEVLSDYDDCNGLHVAFLGKVKGFSCLFRRTRNSGRDSVLIQAKDILRFSHRIPCFQMSGSESEDVPEGSFELDPASLPTDASSIPSYDDDVKVELDEMDTSKSSPGDVVEKVAKSGKNTNPEDFLDPKVKFENYPPADGRAGPKTKSDMSTSLEAKDASKADLAGSKPKRNGKAPPGIIEHQVINSEGDPSINQMEKEFQPDVCHEGSDNFPKDDVELPASANYKVPDPEFYDFDAERNLEKFQIGQIWALYCDEDCLPRYYAQIRKVNQSGLYVAWLAHVRSEDVKPWLDKGMAVPCGRFRITKRKVKKYDNTLSFSHLLRAECADKKDVFAILPRKGEVWSLYKDWSPEIKCSDLLDCRYEFVEVVEEHDEKISCVVLNQVDGFKSVFKPKMEGKSTMTITVLRRELLRFSHQIPAFRLTDERGGSLRGFWELDPAALPSYFFS